MPSSCCFPHFFSPLLNLYLLNSPAIMINSKIYYGTVTKAAKALTEAEKRGEPFSSMPVQAVWASCHEIILPPKGCSAAQRAKLLFTAARKYLRPPQIWHIVLRSARLCSVQNGTGACPYFPTHQRTKCFAMIIRYVKLEISSQRSLGRWSQRGTWKGFRRRRLSSSCSPGVVSCPTGLSTSTSYEGVSGCWARPDYLPLCVPPTFNIQHQRPNS